MTWIGQRPRQTGRLTAGLLAALLASAVLAGCGGGGGGGGSSGGGGGGNTPPETQIVSQAITSAGGAVGTAATNGVEVDIPTGTDLNTSVTSYTIGIYTIPSGSQPTLPAGETLDGSVFDIRSTATNGQPDGGTFSQPVTVVLQYPNTLSQSQLALTEIFAYDPTSRLWQPLPAVSQTINTTNGTISAPATALTYYALFSPTLPGNPMARAKS